jgi:hypothetical protein
MPGYRGIAKNHHRLCANFALINLYINGYGTQLLKSDPVHRAYTKSHLYAFCGHLESIAYLEIKHGIL